MTDPFIDTLILLRKLSNNSRQVSPANSRCNNCFALSLAPSNEFNTGFTRSYSLKIAIPCNSNMGSDKKNVHQLRRMVLDLYSSREDLTRPLIHVVSFGFKYGVPPDANLVFDVRFLPNPYFVPELRPLSGLEDPVYDFVFEKERTKEFVKHLENMFSFLIPLYQEEGKVYLVIGVGCTGGRHRSVSVARWLGELFTRQGQEVIVTHRDLDREG